MGFFLSVEFISGEVCISRTRLQFFLYDFVTYCESQLHWGKIGEGGGIRIHNNEYWVSLVMTHRTTLHILHTLNLNNSVYFLLTRNKKWEYRGYFFSSSTTKLWCCFLNHDYCFYPQAQHKYTFHPEPLTYSEAQQICMREGMVMAMPRSERQWEELLTAKKDLTLQTTDVIWLGLDATSEAGTWVWNTGTESWREADSSSSMWVNWMRGQPSHPGRDLCGGWYVQDPPGWTGAEIDKWDDLGCQYNKSFVCQGM